MACAWVREQFSTNLDPADMTENTDVFVRDVTAGTTTLASQPDAPTFKS